MLSRPGCQKLSSLDLSGCCKTEPGSNIADLRSPTSTSDTAISHNTDDRDRLKRLTYLNLSHCNLVTIRKKVYKDEEIQRLRAQYDQRVHQQGESKSSNPESPSHQTLITPRAT